MAGQCSSCSPRFSPPPTERDYPHGMNAKRGPGPVSPCVLRSSIRYHVGVSIERAIESQIRDAIAAGAFRGLPGEGKPLSVVEGEEFSGDMALGFKILRDAGMAPEWLMLGREVEKDEQELGEINRRHEALVSLAAREGDWQCYSTSLRYYRDQYERQARALRAKQDRYNLLAPGIRTQRPAIWVEYHLERFDARLRAAGAPESFIGGGA